MGDPPFAGRDAPAGVVSASPGDRAVAGGPVRTCVGCRRRAVVADLVRVTRGADGSLLVGRTLPGRGAWLCAGSPDCVAQAAKRRAFERALRAPVAPGAVAALVERLGAEPTSGGADGQSEPRPPQGARG